MLVFLLIVGILALVILGVLLYCNKAYPEALEIAQEMTQVGGDFYFYGTRKVGFLIFSGAKTDDRAYAYLAKLLHDEGYTAVIPRQRFHLSAFGAKHAMEIMDANPEIEKWILIGHSLGGMPASQIAAQRPQRLIGVAFLATFASVDLSNLDIAAIRITAENDGVMNNAHMESYQGNLPEKTAQVMLRGANHQGFAAYKSASGRDGEAAISWQEQNQQSIKLILDFFAEQIHAAEIR